MQRKRPLTGIYFATSLLLKLFKAYRLRDAPTGLTFNNYIQYSHTVFMCLVFI
jgi:hypothetical protein